MLRLALAAAAAAWNAAAQTDCTPWGVHSAYGEDPHTSFSVMWSTRADCASIVQLSTTDSRPVQFVGDSTLFYGNATAPNANVQYIHRVAITGLNTGTKYLYRVGANTTAAKEFSWLTLRDYSLPHQPDGHNYPTLLIYGDMGIGNNSDLTLPRVTRDVLSGQIDAILHIGDLGYDLQDNNGAVGDTFVQRMENVAAHVPYMTIPGNHESDNDFRQYRARFNQMPGATQEGSMFYSFDIGPVHVVMISSEVYFYLTEHGLGLLPAQYTWLEADLASVDRVKTPWVITATHRPLYCSPNDDSDDCHGLFSLLRDGFLGKFALEPLLHKYGVDVHFAAHEHSYERNYPVYQLEQVGPAGPGAYVDYNATVHILSGAAGCPENQDPWQPKGNPFSAKRINTYGYGRLHAVNGTHLFWEFVNDYDGSVVDSIWLIKHTHGPFPAVSGMRRQTSHLRRQKTDDRNTRKEALEAMVASVKAGSRSKRHAHAGASSSSPTLPSSVLRDLGALQTKRALGLEASIEQLSTESRNVLHRAGVTD